jgi:raffinose/stachyose/melibiose transport system permease protein
MQRKNQARIAIAVFLIPGLLYYLVLVLIPISQAFVLSTYRWVSLRSRVFVGFDNYVSVFQNEIFWKSMRASAIFMLVTTTLQVVLGFAIGYFLYMQLRFYRFFKTVFFVPVVLNTVAVGFIWGYIYSPAFGLLKPFLEAIGQGQHYFPPLASPSTALLAVIIAHIWNTLGIQIMMFNAGFMNMPQDVMEMASIEGASGFRLIWHMVIPMAWEITKTVIVLQIIAGLRVFDLVFVMTNGGPNHATELLPLHMFATAFENFNIGNGSVVAVIIFVLCMGLTLGLRKVMARETLQY